MPTAITLETYSDESGTNSDDEAEGNNGINIMTGSGTDDNGAILIHKDNTVTVVRYAQRRKTQKKTHKVTITFPSLVSLKFILIV